MDCVFRNRTARNNPTIRDLECVQDTDDVKLSVTSAFNILHQAIDEVVFDPGAEERRMERDHTVHIMKEKHDDRRLFLTIIVGKYFLQVVRLF